MKKIKERFVKLFLTELGCDIVDIVLGHHHDL